MTININPNRINIQTGAGKLAERKREQASPDSRPPLPARAHVNVMPSVESLGTMIRSAVAALRQGVTWDRGTILNLLV